MKKVLFAIIAAVSLSNAFAADEIVSGGEITPTNCAVLGESVRINLSANVNGAYECNEGLNAINVGACHTSGSRNNSLVCAIATDDGAGNVTYNNAQCNAQNVGQTVTLTQPDYRGFRATTTGGSVAAQMLGGACTTATAETLVGFN